MPSTVVTDPIVRVLRRLDTSDLDSCWLWPGWKNEAGYGMVHGAERDHMVHRVVFEHFVGPVPEGLVLDHLCRVKGCVNYSHVEPVAQRTNVLRGEGLPAENAVKDACKHGHEFTPENTRVRKDGSRLCRACEARRQRERRAA